MIMSSRNFIVFERRPGYAVIRLDRPERKNAVVNEMYTEIMMHLETVAKDDDIKLVLLTGTGEYFTSGADFSKRDGFNKSKILEALQVFKSFGDCLINFPKPIIAAVNGPAIGIGVTLLPLCDLVWGSDNATFSTPFSRIGITPECCSSYTFPKIMGYALASEVLLFNRVLKVEEALRCGLVGEVFRKDEFQTKVEERIQDYLDNPAKSLLYGKALIRGWDTEVLMKCNAVEVERLAERQTSKDVVVQAKKFAEQRRKIKEQRMKSSL